MHIFNRCKNDWICAKSMLEGEYASDFSPQILFDVVVEGGFLGQFEGEEGLADDGIGVGTHSNLSRVRRKAIQPSIIITLRCKGVGI